jgi:hypothetical protein
MFTRTTLVSLACKREANRDRAQRRSATLGGMRYVFVVMLIAACGPDAEGEDSGSDETDAAASTDATGFVTGSDTNEGDGPGSEVSADTSSGGAPDPSDDWNVLAWLRADGVLELVLVNHDASTCADPLATPPFETEPCNLESDLWRVDFTLEPPYEVPGMYETSAPGGGPTLRASLTGTSADGCSHGFISGIDASLTLDSLSDVDVAGTTSVDDPRFPDVPFSVALCQ